MDSVIQGLTQSALVQKLSETEHNVKRFTHDIPDNAPYRSFNKVEVVPYMGTSHPNSTNRFKISRHGYLNRMYLKVVVQASLIKSFTDILPSAIVDSLEQGPEFFANFFTSAKLVIGGKTVETLYAENIMHNAFQHKGAVGEHIMKGLHGYSHLTDPDLQGFANQNLAWTFSQGHFFSFIIPLDFSIMKFHKDALDTNFLNKMEVVLEKRQLLGYQDVTPNDVTKASLVCMYHTLHNHFKNQIRNTNFAKDTSTLITNQNYLLTAVPKREIVAGALPFERHTYDIQLDLFATDILITFRKEAILEPITSTGEIRATPARLGILNFKLMAQNRVLYDKPHYEVQMERDAISSMDIQDQSCSIQSKEAYYPDRSRYIPLGNTDLELTNNFADNGRESPTLYRIPLTMFGTDEFLNGGLNLKSLTNVQLIIEGDDLRVGEIEAEPRQGMKAQVVIRHKTITRIDGKTGSVTV